MNRRNGQKKQRKNLMIGITDIMNNWKKSKMKTGSLFVKNNTLKCALYFLLFYSNSV